MICESQLRRLSDCSCCHTFGASCTLWMFLIFTLQYSQISSYFTGVATHYGVLAFSVIHFHSPFPYTTFSPLLFPLSVYLLQCPQSIFCLVFTIILRPIGFHSNTLLGILFSFIRITCPSQAILLLFIHFTTYALSISSFSSSFILILQDRSSFCAGPEIFF